MIHADFTYNGISCDTYGVYIGEFSNREVGKTSISHETNLNTAHSRKNNTFHIISQNYSSPLSFEMQVFNRDFGDISQEHERALKKWLMKRGKYEWFHILDKRYANLWFKANIHSPTNIFVNHVIGISFQVSTNSPYAFSDLIEYTIEFSNNGKTASIYVDNDEDSPIYPEMEITMLSDGDLIISNSIDTNTKNQFKLTDLKAGEKITIYNEIPFMESTRDTLLKTVYDRFSKYWFFLADGNNVITVSNNCILTLRYRETRKVGI